MTNERLGGNAAEGSGIEIEAGARRTRAERVEDVRREDVRLLQAGHLAAQRAVRSEQRIGQRDEAVAVVDGVGAGKRVAVAEVVVGAQRAEIFADAFAWGCSRQGGAAGQPVSPSSSGPLGCGQNAKYGSIAGFRLATWRVDARGIGQQSQARLRVGNHAHAADRQRLPEAFVVAEQEQRFFLSGPPSAPPNWFRRKGGTEPWSKKLRASSALLRRNSKDAIRAARWFPIASRR